MNIDPKKAALAALLAQTSGAAPAAPADAAPADAGVAGVAEPGHCVTCGAACPECAAAQPAA